MKRSTITVVVLLLAGAAISQQPKFNRVFDNATINWGSITGITQDRLGYIWVGTSQILANGSGGLHRYDGTRIISFRHDPQNPNSIANNWIHCVMADSLDAVWVGTFGFGLDRLDLSTNTFTHFRHNPNDGSSLSNDTVTAILEDHLGNIWVGTFGGLDLLNKKTGKFTHYRNNPNDSSSLSSNYIQVIYEDRQGVLWIGCFDFFRGVGGLNKFNRTSGNFVRYKHDPGNPNSIANNEVGAIFEDSRGNFWVGTAGEGLHTMDRGNGSFTHHYYDPKHPEKLGPSIRKDPKDRITFISEDAAGAIWIGSFHSGINKYDPITQKTTHYGNILQNGRIVQKDSTNGFNESYAWRSFTSKDKQFWIATREGNLYNINLFKTGIPFYSINGMDGNAFYHDTKSNILWMGTGEGLVRKDMNSGSLKILQHDSLNANSLAGNNVVALRVDKEGKLWMATDNGLSRYDPYTGTFTNWRQKEGDISSRGGNFLHNLCFDHNKNVWVGSFTGLSKLDVVTGKFTNYSSNTVRCIAVGKNNEIWAGTHNGLNRLNTNTTKFSHYLKNLQIVSVYVDSKGEVWAGARNDNLYRYDRNSDQFKIFTGPNPQGLIIGVLHMLEDDKNNLWLHTPNSIVKINGNRDGVTVYGADYGVHPSNFLSDDNFISDNGQIFIGDEDGYYAFFPDQLKGNIEPPELNFIGFKLGKKPIIPMQGGIFESPIWQTKNIKLNHDQNSFSFEFGAVNFTSPGALRYHFMLENYDNSWHDIESDHQAYFYNVPPGKYILHAKAINTDGTWGEKTINIVISPPWWRTWWAYCIYGLLVFGGILVLHRFMKQRVIVAEKEKTRAKELAQAKEIEKAYHELKATQQQLIQSEKMASLGELTAGIAHEIQNPLNFVNNFSDVNAELIDEANQEIGKGNITEVKSILKDLKDNEQKINHHGRRADSIVKSMLQHSRSSSGQKEPTDINALADEYLRLAYHGMRAKDKTFNVKTETNFDSLIGKINVVPQEIGRVILNLINNAFYAVDEKRKQNLNGYEPTVSVSTKKLDGKVEIKITDNGNGIPQKLLDKIFQPFFTTKPTGQGTGLGLSLAYDIVKAHGGEITVNTDVGEYTEFILRLPS